MRLHGMTMMVPGKQLLLYAWCVVCGLLWPALAHPEVLRVEVETRQDVLDGQPFGSVGAYEKLTGKIYFALAPEHPVNMRIVDLARAPRNAAGQVEAWGNFMVLQPKQPRQEQRLALLEVSNRGGKAALTYFNGARLHLNPTSPEHFGDGLLLRQGLTIIWVGWQYDVPPLPGLLRLYAPVATDHGRPITGLVRSDWTVDQTVTTLPLGH
jgi:hypothetical protein